MNRKMADFLHTTVLKSNSSRPVGTGWQMVRHCVMTHESSTGIEVKKYENLCHVAEFIGIIFSVLSLPW